MTHDDHSVVFDELGSATRHLRGTRIHFVLLFYLLLDLRTVPVLLLILGDFGSLRDVVTPTHLRLDLLDGACHLLDAQLRLVFPFLLEAVAISLLFVEILTLVGVRPIVLRGLERLAIFGCFSQLATLVLALLNLDVLDLGIVDFDFLEVARCLIILLHNVLHVLDFGLLVLITYVVVHRVTDGRTGAALVDREDKLIAFAVDLGDHVVLL